MLTTSYSDYQIHEVVSEALITLDEKDCFVYVNQFAGDMLEREPEELLGKHIWTEFPEAADQPVYKAYIKATQSKKHIYLEEYNSAKDKWFENHIYQSPGGVSVSFRDITERKMQEEKIRESEEKWRKLVSSIPDFIALHDLDEKFTFVNHYAEGYSEKEILGNSVYDFIAGESKEEYKRNFRECIGFNETKQFNHKAFGDNGTSRTYENVLVPIVDKNKQVVNVMAIAKDITDRLLTEEAVQAAHKSYFDIFNSSSEAIYILDEAGTFVDVNKGAEEMYQYSKEELIGQTPESVAAPGLNNIGEIFQLMQTVRTTGAAVRFDFWAARKNGEFFLKEVIVNRGTYFGKTVLIATARDITERKEAEALLHAQEKLYRKLIENSNDGVIILNAWGMFRYVAPSIKTVLGYTEEELLNTSLLDITHPDDHKKVVEIYTELLARPGLYNPEFIPRIKHKNGTWRCISGALNNLISDPVVHGVIGNFRDVTQQVLAEQAIRESEIKYRSVIDNAADAIAIYDAGGNVLDVNITGLSMLGYNKEEILQKKMDDFFTKHDQGNGSVSYEKLQPGDSDLSQRYIISKNGTLVLTEVRLQVLPDGNLLSIVRDLTERMEAQERIRKEKELSDSIISRLPGIFYLYDEEGHFIRWNKNFEKVTGYSSAEISSMHFLDFYEKESHGFIGEKMKTAFENDSPGIEVELHTKEGNNIPFYINSFTIDYEGKKCFTGIGIDLSARRKAEMEIAEKTAQIENLSDNLPETMIYQVALELDGQVHFTYVSKAVEKLIDKTAEEVLNNSMLLYDVILEEDRQKLAEAELVSFLKMSPVNVDVRMMKANGNSRWVNIRSVPRKTKDGRVIWDGVDSDITERKHVEEQLRISSEKYSSLVNSIDGIVWEIDALTNQFTFVSQQAEELFGYPVQQWITEPDFWANHMHEADRDWVVTYCTKHTREKKPYDFEYRMIAADGRVVWLHNIITVVMEKSEPVKLRGLMLDITEKKIIEKGLEDYKFALNQSSIVDVSDNNGLIQYANENFCRISGYSLEELRGQDHRILKSGYHSKEHYQNLWETVTSGRVWRSEVKNKAKNGSYYWVDSTIVPFLDDEGKPFQFITIRTDITKRKEGESLVLDTLERYDMLSKATSDTIWDWDIVHNTIIYNQGIVKNFGYTETNVKKVKEWWDMNIHPDDKKKVTVIFEKAFAKRKTVLQVEYRYRCADGTYRNILDRAFVIYDKNKKPERMIGSMQDITHEKEFAIRLEKEVIDAQEREWNQIGMELHDNVNQILAASMLLMGLGKEKMDRGQNAASIIHESEKHVGEAIAEIRRLSHQLAPVSVDNLSLEQVFESLIETVNVKKQFKVKLQMKVVRDLKIPHKLQINLYRILQAQLNNIIKHANATEVIISMKKSGDSFIFRIADNGIGFDPGAYTTGIGLENINRRAKVFSGEFTLNTAPGKGCEIIVEIPLSLLS